MHHLHHTKSVGYVHAELCGEFQPGLVDMAVIGFLISEALQHPQKGKYFFLFKIVEQTAGRNQHRRIRYIDTNPPDPVI